MPLYALLRYLDDVLVLIANNQIESAIRLVAVERKN
ncbi:MAG: transposase [Serratia symbiotica]|nr:transposase [Serratia symbiotica]